MQIQKSISLDVNTWKLIDELRVAIPRSRYVAKILADGLTDLDYKTIHK